MQGGRQALELRQRRLFYPSLFKTLCASTPRYDAERWKRIGFSFAQTEYNCMKPHTAHNILISQFTVTLPNLNHETSSLEVLDEV